MRQGAVVTRVGNIEYHEQPRQPKAVAHKHFDPEQDFETIVNEEEQGKHC